MSTLLMDLKVGQSLSIDGGRLFVTLEEKSGQRVKLRFVHEGATIERAAPGSLEQRRPGPSGAAQAMWGVKATA